MEMHDGGIDTHALATAADKAEKAAEKSAQASRDFANTAKNIQAQVGNAVDKLNLQASVTNETLRASQRPIFTLDAASPVGFGGSPGTPQDVRITLRNTGGGLPKTQL